MIIIQLKHTNLGGYGNFTHHDEVYQFDVTNETWIQVGTLQQARYLHAVTVVHQDDIAQNCQKN